MIRSLSTSIPKAFPSFPQSLLCRRRNCPAKQPSVNSLMRTIVCIFWLEFIPCLMRPALACGVAGVPVPYKTLISNNSKLLCPHSISEGDIVCDPAKMAIDILGRLWEHIVKLQNLNDLEPRFRIAKWYGAHRRRTMTANTMARRFPASLVQRARRRAREEHRPATACMLTVSMPMV